MFPPIVFFTLFFASCAYALWRGGAPERAIACAFLVAGLTTPLLDLPELSRFSSVAYGVLAIDLLLFGALCLIAVRADRFWPIVVAGLQLVSLLAHLVRLANPELIRPAYSIMLVIWSYPQLLLLVMGTMRHRTRTATGRPDTAWRASSRVPIR